MTEQEVFRRLNELSHSDADGLRKLADEIALQCREPAVTVLTEWVGGPPSRKTPCAFVCSNLKELALGEMLGRADSTAPALRVQMMEMVATQQFAFRELMLTALEPLLQDLTPAGSTASGTELRTCDAAYLLVRKIVRRSGAGASQAFIESEFTALTEIEKDEEIERWLQSATWKELFPEPP